MPEATPEDEQRIAEAALVVKLFFTKDEVELQLRDKTKDRYGAFGTLYDYRRKSKKGKPYNRSFYESADMLSYVKKLGAAKRKIGEPDTISEEDVARYKALKLRLEAAKQTHANVGYMMMHDKAGFTPTGVQRRPFQYGSISLNYDYTTRTFATVDALEKFFERYLSRCMTKAQADEIMKLNQLLLKKQVSGRFRCDQSLTKPPVFRFVSHDRRKIPDFDGLEFKDLWPTFRAVCKAHNAAKVA